MTTQPRVLTHDHCGLAGGDEKYIHRQRGCRIDWIKTTFFTGEIEGAEWLMNEHRPAASANEPRNRRAPTVRAQAITSLTVSHLVFVATPIKLWPTFAQSEQRPIAKIEEDGARYFIDAK